jgi:hypothetical protein
MFPLYLFISTLIAILLLKYANYMKWSNQNILISLASENKFFIDFINYLKYLEKQPIKTTVTGNISLTNITALLDGFQQREIFDDYQKFGWKIRSEDNLEFLSQIRIIAEIMKLTFKRKREIKLSKTGYNYLHDIDQLTQYLNMVLSYWSHINWDYFSPSREVGHETVVGTLQKNRKIIWTVLGRNGQGWIDFKAFADSLRDIFDLNKFYIGDYDTDFSYYLDIEYGLFYKNLVRFGCVEIKEKYYSKLKRISRFRGTPLGELMFLKALETWI